VNKAGVAAEDIRGVVTGIFKRPKEFIGKTVGIVGDDILPQRYAEIMSRVLGSEVRYNYTAAMSSPDSGFPARMTWPTCSR
jgi:hypothetical protein